MSYRFVKRQNAIGWDWYLESDDCSSWVSPLAKKVIETLEAENAKLRELVRDMFGGYKGAVEMLPSSYSKNVAERAVMDISDRMRELGIEVDA